MCQQLCSEIKNEKKKKWSHTTNRQAAPPKYMRILLTRRFCSNLPRQRYRPNNILFIYLCFIFHFPMWGYDIKTYIVIVYATLLLLKQKIWRLVWAVSVLCLWTVDRRRRRRVPMMFNVFSSAAHFENWRKRIVFGLIGVRRSGNVSQPHFRTGF